MITQLQLGEEFVNNAIIVNIIITEKDKHFKSINNDYTKIPYKQVIAFYNVDRCDAYNLSYDETLLIDADYLILSDTLNSCWGHENEFMMNWSYPRYNVRKR